MVTKNSLSILSKFIEIMLDSADTRTRRKKYRQVAEVLPKIADDSWIFAGQSIRISDSASVITPDYSHHSVELRLNKDICIDIGHVTYIKYMNDDATDHIYDYTNSYVTVYISRYMIADRIYDGGKLSHLGRLFPGEVVRSICAERMFDCLACLLFPGIPVPKSRQFADVCIIF